MNRAAFIGGVWWLTARTAATARRNFAGSRLSMAARRWKSSSAIRLVGALTPFLADSGWVVVGVSTTSATHREKEPFSVAAEEEACAGVATLADDADMLRCVLQNDTRTKKNKPTSARCCASQTDSRQRGAKGDREHTRKSHARERRGHDEGAP